MMWKKRGLIYCPNGTHTYDLNSFTTPSAHCIHQGEIRVYGGVKDAEGRSRIVYVDLDAGNPSNILRVANQPVLDMGNDGCFDDNGVIMGDIIRVGSEYYMYYVGFQHVQKVKFFAFTGLAISKDNGESFQRYAETPILDRTNHARFLRCAHTVLYDEGRFKMWYAIGNGWQYINEKPYPAYNIWYIESDDGIHFPSEDRILCVDNRDNEYRIGRPKVYKRNGHYCMLYTRDFITKDYVAGYAESTDGIHWVRQDEKLGLVKSESGWDSEMACYPVLFDCAGKTYMFYNGNGMGTTGFGYAELISE